jgi:hypothetical protein
MLMCRYGRWSRLIKIKTSDSMNSNWRQISGIPFQMSRCIEAIRTWGDFWRNPVRGALGEIAARQEAGASRMNSAAKRRKLCTICFSTSSFLITLRVVRHFELRTYWQPGKRRRGGSLFWPVLMRIR